MMTSRIAHDGLTIDPDASCGGPAHAWPDYQNGVLDALDSGDGVAAFVVTAVVCTTVLYCPYKLTGRAREISTDAPPESRATQLIAIQRAARQRAACCGYRAQVI
jgi:hypothetical protein